MHWICIRSLYAHANFQAKAWFKQTGLRLIFPTPHKQVTVNVTTSNIALKLKKIATMVFPMYAHTGITHTVHYYNSTIEKA